MSDLDLTFLYIKVKIKIKYLEMKCFESDFLMQNMRASLSEGISERLPLDLSLFSIHAMLNNFFVSKRFL